MVPVRESGLEFAAYFNCSRNIIPFEEENRTTTIHQYLQYLIHLRAQSGKKQPGGTYKYRTLIESSLWIHMIVSYLSFLVSLLHVRFLSHSSGT